MNDKNIWLYNEKVQAGADYSDVERAIAYDERMQNIRNSRVRAGELIKLLELNKDNHLVIDFGCGTGELTAEIAKSCRRVIGVDTSAVMLEIASKRTKTENIHNIEFHNAGFLTYNHEGDPADRIMTSGAFHHLPDFWKVIALNRMYGMLKCGGLLLISDVIFSFKPEDYINEINTFLKFIKDKAGEALFNDGILHVKEEFSTFDWLMDEMLKQTGFEIYKKVALTKTNIDYLCIKK